MSKAGQNLKTRVFDLPLTKTDYFPILCEDNASKMRAGMVTLKPGRDVGSHNTEDYEEFIIVLEGRGLVETQGESNRPISQGQVAYNPPRSQHNIRNSGGSVLRYVYVVSKA
jgi:mannose-6-phosphate isomerase-like protein (cupin superfamily)